MERRNEVRVPFAQRFTSYLTDRPLRALGHNVSATGLAMATASALRLEPGARLTIELDLCDPEADPIWAAAQICQLVRGAIVTHVGVCFTSLARRDEARLVAYCQRTHHATLDALLRTWHRPHGTTRVSTLY